MKIWTTKRRIKEMLEDVGRYHAERLSKSDNKECERVQRIYEEYQKEEKNK